MTLMGQGYQQYSQLDSLYENGSITQKRKIIGPVFPEKLTFDGSQYRTSRINEALEHILLIDNKIQGKKTGQTHQI